MGDKVIHIEHLGKQYCIGQKTSYRTLREAIMDAAKAPFRSLKNTKSENNTEYFWALKDISFDVEKGEIIGIIGRNGAGKSTLLKILSRITEPTEGRAEIRGRVGSLLEVGTGFHPELTGRENIYLSGSILGMKRSEIDKKFDAIVKFAETEKFLDTPLKRYSSGMQVRLGFAVAAHMEPEILIVDEVLAVGDLTFQKKSLGKMNEVAKDGRTVLFVSHNMGAVHNLCSRCVLLKNGQVSMDGPTEQVIQKYLLENNESRDVLIKNGDSSKPINLRKAWLETLSGHRSSEIRYDEGFRVIIEYEVNSPISECCIWTGIRTVEDVIAFDTADTDMDVSLFDVRKPGYYRSVIAYPPKWLNAGNYYCVAGIVRYNPETTYDRAEICSFTVLDIGTPEKTRTGQSRPGILQPYMSWKTEKVSNNQ